MKRQTWIINLIIIGIILIGVAFFISKFGIEKIEQETTCAKTSTLKNIAYNFCYDEKTKNLIFNLERMNDKYTLEEFKIAVDEEEFKIASFPNNNEKKTYYFFLEKMPEKIYIMIHGDFSTLIEICQTPKPIQIEKCGSDFNLSSEFNKGNETNATGKIKITSEEKKSTNLPGLNLCEAEWACSPWSLCIQGEQKRNCQINNNCKIPINFPEKVRSCLCQENWECTWPKCINGKMTPTCIDKNNCNTEENKPKETACTKLKNCSPKISCEEWGECQISYDLKDIIKGNNPKGIMYRKCQDSLGCVSSFFEIQTCSISTEIYSKVKIENNTEFIELYNKNTGEKITTITLSEKEKISFNIEFN